MKKTIPNLYIFLGIGAILCFVSLFLYSYKKSGNFRKSILNAFLAVAIIFGKPLPARSNSFFADGFTPLQHERTRTRPGELSNSPGGPDKPNNNNNGSGNDDPSIPDYPKPESVRTTKERVDRIGDFRSELEKITQKRKDKVCSKDPIRIQMTSFLDKNGVPDIDRCLTEVHRRAAAAGRPDFKCTRERFLSLATENGEFGAGEAKEAITILEGEARGFYKNPRREYYGPGLKGPDFMVEGCGKFQNITHVEVKNPVGSATKALNNETTSITREGRQIGRKFDFQQKLWSDPIEAKRRLKSLDPQAPLAESRDNFLGLFDCWDVPSHEKAAMEASIVKGAKNNTNIVFINNK